MTLNENPETVRMVEEVRDTIDEILAGEYLYCRNCMTQFRRDRILAYGTDEDEESLVCPECGDELEEMTVGDYFDDNLGVDFTVDQRLGYRGCRICVAWGGPGIWVDTMTSKVDLRWWGDNAEVMLSNDAVDAIDEHFEEEWETILGCRGVRL